MQTYVSVKSHYVSYLLTGAMLRAMDVKHQRYSGSVSSAGVERLLGTFMSTRQINVSNKMCPYKDEIIMIIWLCKKAKVHHKICQ